MDPAQFQNYTIGLAQQETERRAIQTTREQIRDLIRQTQTCDGSSTSAVRNWIREVTSDSLARQLIEHAAPISLDKAITATIRFCERNDAYGRLGRHESPMEIGAANVSSCKTTEPLVVMVDSLACTVQKLATKLAKIEARHDPRPPPTTTRRYMPTPGSGNDRRVPRDAVRRTILCFYCGKIGHYARVCRLRNIHSQPSGNGVAPQVSRAR